MPGNAFNGEHRMERPLIRIADEPMTSSRACLETFSTSLAASVKTLIPWDCACWAKGDCERASRGFELRTLLKKDIEDAIDEERKQTDLISGDCGGRCRRDPDEFPFSAWLNDGRS